MWDFLVGFVCAVSVGLFVAVVVMVIVE